jgi:tetratricopeptide (TPR) repeat protein
MNEFAAGLHLQSKKMLGLALLGAGLLVWQANEAEAQTQMACHTMGEVEETPPDKLPAPEKLSGIGNAHIKITGTPEAQMWFDQGLNLLHDFWDFEAGKAFEQAIRADSNCAMCYWGQYQTEIFRHGAKEKYAADALANAVRLKKKTTKAERLYIEASAAGEAEAIARKGRGHHANTKEIKAWRKLVKENPADTQARIFLAESLSDGYEEKGEPRAGQKEALAILQGVLKDEPENSAANHYWIHAVEASPRPEQALHSAEILGRLAPSSGHMVHMPGHIYYRTGDYATAQKSFAASTTADEAYMQAQNVKADDDWNYVHNLMYSIANLLEMGRLKEATALSEKSTAARGQLAATLYVHSPRDSMARLDPRLPVAVRTADWAQVLTLLKAVQPEGKLTNLDFLRKELLEFATGMQAIDTQEIAKAEEASMRFDAELGRKMQQVKEEKAAKEKNKNDAAEKGAPKMKVMPDAMLEPLVKNLSVMSLELRAEIALDKKQKEEAKKLFAQAEKEEKDLGYHEPPFYVRPVAETEGAALMAALDWTGAKAAYEKALVERPKSGFSLYGIALSNERGGDAKAANAKYAEFMTAWKDADAGLPEMAHAQAYLAEHKGVASGN